MLLLRVINLFIDHHLNRADHPQEEDVVVGVLAVTIVRGIHSDGHLISSLV